MAIGDRGGVWPAATSGRAFAIAAALVAAFAGVCLGVRGADGKDFLELTLLTRYALTEGPPYHDGAARQAYREAGVLPVPEPDPFPGFLYPPALFPVVAPFAFLPHKVGAVCWFAFLTALAVATVFLLASLSARGAQRDRTALLALGVLFMSSVTQSALLVGQTAMILAFGAALGAVAAAKRRWVSAGLGWGLVAVKPQLGLPFLAVAAIQGGWRGLAAAVCGAAGLTGLGAALTGSPLETLLTYFPHASQTVFQIGYNRVTNDQIVGWNRALFVFTGYELDLSIAGMLAGYAAFGAAAWLRAGRSGSLGYWLAAAAIAAPVFGQGKGYDLVLLVLWLPHLVAAWTSGRRRDLVVFLIAAVLISLPRGGVLALIPRPELVPVVASYRTWASLGLAAWLIVSGPVRGPTRP